MRSVALAIALSVLVAPGAAAEAVAGTLLVKGGLTLPPTATLDLTPRALFLPSLSGVQTFHATLRDVTVHVYREDYVEAPVLDQRPRLPAGNDSPRWETPVVDVTIEGPARGWLGIEPGEGSTLHAALGVATAVEGAARTRLGDRAAPADTPSPDSSVYCHTVAEAHALTDVRSWTFSGPGMLKVMGPILRLTSDTNTTTVDAGSTRDEGPPARSTDRWIAIEFGSGQVTVEGASTQVAADGGVATWDGIAAFGSATGKVRGASRDYTGTGSAATLDGTLRAKLAPVASAGVVDLSLAVAGDLQDSTLVPEGANVRVADSSWIAWLPIILLGVAAGAGGAVYLHRRRAAPAKELSAEDYAKLGEAAADAERYDEAAEWIAHARRASPTSRRLVVEHAYALARAGRRAEAMATLADASDEDPDAALLEARLLAEDRRDEAAAPRLILALDRAPALLLDVEGDATFERLRARDDVRQAMRRASRALR